MGLASTQLARGNGNFFTYVEFSRASLPIRKGDVLTYDVWLDPRNPEPKGGIDINISGTESLRDHHILDQNGIDAHGDGLLTPAVGKWYARRIPLDDVSGHRTEAFLLDFEGDAPGRYLEFVDNVAIVHPNGSRSVVFPGAHAPVDRLDGTDGYSDHPSFALIPRADVDSKPPSTLMDEVVNAASRYHSLSDCQAALALAEALNRATKSESAAAAIAAVHVDLDQAANQIEGPEAPFAQSMDRAHRDLAKLDPFMKGFTADAVGHAHIDVQWLWEQQESFQAAHDTWNQAVKFMDEFPDFKFSQSSAGYYREIQNAYPELFAKIQKYVKQGQWDIVGGRECEADENMISPEAHARQFLYAQRYFRQVFGKTATVGWEPDTFGHTAQTPQIMKLGGCDAFYFCRGGKGEPLFNWEGLDGTKLLSFCSPDAGAWYNMNLDNEALSHIPPYAEKSGAKDIMWVYGVGNHGGGPSRENIDQVHRWQKEPGTPSVRFRTAQEFFDRVRPDQAHLPTVSGELEGVFMGCFTTNATVKRLNRFAEADLSSSEAVASVANYLGNFPYPKDQFAKDWEKITFNQHHDTLCGSSFHWAYGQTMPDLNRVIADAKDVQRDALDYLSLTVKPLKKSGETFMVFNPTGWARSGWAAVRTPGKMVNDRPAEVLRTPVAATAGGVEIPVRVIDPVTHAAEFYATDVPAFGYRLYTIREGSATFGSTHLSSDHDLLESDNLRVRFDLARGCISSLVEKSSVQEFAGPHGLAVLEDHLEKTPNDAWSLGQIVGVKPFAATSAEPLSGPGWAGIKFSYPVPDHPETVITQTFRLDDRSEKVDVDFEVNWKVVSNPREPSPLVRLAFDGAAKSPTATYQIPFGAVTRPTDGGEGPAQAWADISGPAGGVSVIEDCKHGFSAKGSTLRMSVIRGIMGPDMLPNPGEQPLHYAIIPHVGDWRAADATRRAAELEQPLLVSTIPSDAQGIGPSEFSFAHPSDPFVVPTCLKKAEDGDGFVIRMFESIGHPDSATLNLCASATNGTWTNFIEDPLGMATLRDREVKVDMRPWEIKTLRVYVPGPRTSDRPRSGPQ
jgi:alpha-mannosidase